MTKTMRIKKPSGAKDAKDIVEHSTRAHALLSASGAHRWINCPPSAKLEEAEGPREDTAFTKEGTIAHEIAELFVLRDVCHTITDDEFLTGIFKVQEEELYRDEMMDYCQYYSDYIKGLYGQHAANNSCVVCEVEQRLDLSEYVPDSFGTADCCVISDGTLEVIDFKYGKGVPVSAEWNPQGLLYGLGALRKYDLAYDIDKVVITIVQPRIDNISTFSISVEDLHKWAEEVARPAALLAFEGKGELKTGAWCKFCAVKAKCRAQYNENAELLKKEFADPLLLSDDEVAEVLNTADKLSEWVEAVKKYAQEKAITDGKVWPGYKLVHANTMRKWVDETVAAMAIKDCFPEISDDQIYNMKLKGITEVQKLVGKKNFDAMLSEVVVKPEGAPTLVPASDKRPAIGLEDAVNDFTNK